MQKDDIFYDGGWILTSGPASFPSQQNLFERCLDNLQRAVKVAASALFCTLALLLIAIVCSTGATS